MHASKRNSQFSYPVTADNLSLRKLLPADTSQAGMRLLLQSVPVCRGAFFTMKRSERTCRSEFHSCHRIADLEEVPTRIFVLAPVRPRGCLRACAMWIEIQVCQVGCKKHLSSVGQYEMERVLQLQRRKSRLPSSVAAAASHTHRDHIITLSLDPMISGFERIFDPAAIFP